MNGDTEIDEYDIEELVIHQQNRYKDEVKIQNDEFDDYEDDSVSQDDPAVRSIIY